MTKDAVIEFGAAVPGAQIDQPFEKDLTTTVARHGATRRWFARYMEVKGEAIASPFTSMYRANHLRVAPWRATVVVKSFSNGWSICAPGTAAPNSITASFVMFSPPADF